MKTNTKKRPAETDAAVPDADSPTKKAKSMEEDDAKVVHVGNLPWTATDAEITAAFSTFGAVTLVRQMVGKKGKTAGKKTGIAYVHFATRKAAAAAAAAGAMKIGERETRVSASRPKGEKATSGLFVANLPYAATAEAVTEFFGGEHGEVTHCHVPKEEDGTAKGHAFVTFKSVDAAKAAFEAKKGAEFEGRKIRLDYCKPFVRSARGSGKGH
ncbi:hypothetical protein DFJ73DRAFT_842691 [Zopfochytrium polystomum]|nr:hypothetical protein DFJ73DRAFT_842691 [Zopfochytrium polystomum]